jgi:type II secretion system protein H
MSSRGFSLLETLIVLAVIGLMATLAIVRLEGAYRRTALNQAAEEVRSALHLTRSTAIRHNRNAALRFETDAFRGATRIYRDGDGDGVLARDIEATIDRPEGPLRQLGHPGLRIRFGFPAGATPRDPGDPSRRLDRLDDPIRFNRSNMASFDPFGAATPGSVYLTDGVDGLVAVRVFGRSGRIRILRWDPRADRWTER